MPTIDEYAPGTPSWVDFGSTDLPASIRFYTQLFGWTAEDQGDESGNYTMFVKDGRMIAGGMKTMAEGQPSAWMTYVSVEDADATTQRIRDAGGAIFVEPMDVLTVGRMVVAADTAGAAFGLWQPKDHRGAGLVNEPGALIWNELNTRDVDASLAFYPSVFDWEPNTHKGEMDYTEWMLGGRSVAGMMAMPAAVPADVPSHWLTYFGTADCDGTAEAATKLGATVVMPPTDIEPGRFAVMVDPVGAVFGVLQSKGT